MDWENIVKVRTKVRYLYSIAFAANRYGAAVIKIYLI